MTTLTAMLRQSACRFPERVFVHHAGEDFTYAQIWNQAVAVAAWLSENGLQLGDRVAILLKNSPEYVASYFGTLLAGGTVVGLNPDTTPRELTRTLNHCTVTALVYHSASSDLLQETVPQVPSLRLFLQADEGVGLRASDGLPRACFGELLRGSTTGLPTLRPPHVAQIIYTSGTSGKPKGVTLSHRNLVANTRSIIQYLKLTEEDAVLVILPFFYSYGNSLLLTHMAVGGRLILASDFVFWSRTLDLMQEQEATGFSGVPSSYAMLLHRTDFLRRRFPTLRYLTCAGGGLAPAVVQRLREAFPHVELYLMYGQTEASARLSSLMPEDVDRKLGSIGKGIPGVELQVLDDEGTPVKPGDIGEIVARGDNIMLGYWNDPEETAKVLRPEGLRTGDLATVDEEGYIYVVGRKSDLIKSGAYRIHPKEIEDVILELQGVAEVAVVGMPDPILYEVPVAFIVPSKDAHTLTEQDVVDHCLRNLPRYKAVRGVHFVEALPKTSSGKVRRAELKERFAALYAER
jgi:long-chain acyl-CoA synthetase